MSIQPDMEKWKRRFFACLVLATAALFLTGAREVTHDLRRRPLQRQQIDADLRDWGCALLAEDAAPANSPATLSESSVRFLVEACSQPAQPQGVQDSERR